ncbi:hypothetical protein IMG5_067400 [Ichthyophthirius multifiliis]|uniref:Uncharacterized protein n=1 Tax=Ichthyophthirius multifiliis TaxID=5932 RepID=G0QPF7_ICHMU|nr:hypothetical protein IMG5_067400 [Ichthyophthirius multifiliis]EGR32899.1 hypothetical protein IMG5_067400 [Ichthyophthirius multifiliis]|eukprot:XP_004036885.1 hypothetical protein IMG5_067400 [Ichthyophthirius multifiliis]
MQIEPWADPGEPDQEEAFERQIFERKIFQIIPKSGQLKKGQLKDVELIYNPNSKQQDDNPFKSKNDKNLNGQKHSLRVVLQIMNGKPLQINLKGMSLAPLEGLLAVKKNQFELPDTPIGLLIPVKFPIEIANLGSIKVSYKVEIEEQDCDQNIIKNDSRFTAFLLEKSQDTLLPNEKSYLYCLFKPLEQKGYYYKLKIIVFDMVKITQEIIIFIKGQGFLNLPPVKNQLNAEEIPRQRSSVSTIGSKVFFSIEEIDFGYMKPGKESYRFIILYNLNENQKLNFDFGSSSFALTQNKPGLMCGDKCIIEPIQGVLEPKSFIELKLALACSYDPSVYEGELECTINWDLDKNNQQQFLKNSIVSTFNKNNNNNNNNNNNQSNNNTLQKETLFLRIKKKSLLNVNLINNYINQSSIENTQQYQQKTIEELFQGKNLKQKHAFELIIEKALNEILNESNTERIIGRIDNQPIGFFKYFDDENSVSIISNQWNDFRYLFLQQEFVDLVDLIMENTFFNIIQETTRKECDLLKISKTFVMPL